MPSYPRSLPRSKGRILAPPRHDAPYRILTQKPTYAEIVKRQAVSLYRSSPTFVHPSEREHTLQHSCFCRYEYCKYHTTP